MGLGVCGAPAREGHRGAERENSSERAGGHECFSSGWTSQVYAVRYASRMRSHVLLVLGIVLAAFATACAPVRPIDRGRLAHPTMGSGEINIGLDGHVRAVSEGATGGLAGGGGGCGCN